MKGKPFQTATILTSVLLTVSALLFLESTRIWSVTGSPFQNGAGRMTTRVVAENPMVELPEERDLNTRLWQRVREVEVIYPDGRREIDTVRSRVREKGSGICYRNAEGQIVPSDPRWDGTVGGFAVERCVYKLYAGPTLDTPLSYVVQGRELLLRPAALVASDGEAGILLATANPQVVGRVADADPSRLLYEGAFGPGIDIEFAVEPAAVHQNVVMPKEVSLPEGFDPQTARLSVLTEVDLQDYAEQGVRMYAGDSPVDIEGPDLCTAWSQHDRIRFGGVIGGEEVELHAFVESPIHDAGGFGRPLFADRRVFRDWETGKIYLEESIPYRRLSEARFPVVWDWISGQNVPAGETEEWTPKETVYVSSDLSVYGTLIIRPGTTVKIGLDKKITVESGGCVHAVGEPYNFITITSVNDDKSGEDLTGGSTSGEPGDIAYGLWLTAGSSPSSTIQYCKIAYGDAGIVDYRSLDSPIRDNVVREMYYTGILLAAASTDCRNNLIVDCSLDGIYCTAASSRSFTNNTIDSCGDGIHTYGCSGLEIKRNLLTRNDVGIRSQNDTGCIYDYNGFWNSTADFVGVPENEQGTKKCPAGNPYDYLEIGSFFIDTDGYGSVLADGGASAKDALLSAEWYSVGVPTEKTGTIDDQQTWSKHSAYGPDETIYIGYHHCRTDYYVPSGLTIAGSSASLTINPGVVVGMRGGHMLMARDLGELVSVGNPSGGGLNLFTSSESLSMNIESPEFPGPGTNSLIYVQAGASDETRIQFTRTAWLGWGVLIGEPLSESIRHNVFSLSYYGVQGPQGTDLFNNLAHENVCGGYACGDAEVSNCTFDDNDTGLEVFAGSGQSLLIRDSLFTRNSEEGILIDSGLGDVVNSYNGFWENGVPIDGGDAGEGSKLLEQSPYDPHGTYRQRFYLIQHDNELIDGGSRSACDAGLDHFTTCRHGDRDQGAVDIGFHHPSYVDLEATDLYGTLAPSDELDPGAYVHYNIDDDNSNSMKDYLEDSTVTNEDNVKKLKIRVDDSVVLGTVVLSRSSASVQVWKSSTKGTNNKILTGSTYETDTEGNGRKTWDLSDPAQRQDFNSVKNSLYVEGREEGTATLKAKYHKDEIDIEDTVNYTFIGATCGWQPNALDRLTLHVNFGALVGCEYSVTGGQSGAYNCIAWSVEIINENIWWQVDHDYGDDDDVLESSDFDAFYDFYGYTLTGDIDEADILLYKDPPGGDENPEGIEHAARVRSCECGAGKWIMFESKCGHLERLEHRRNQLNGSGFAYGWPFRYYKKE